MQYKKLTLYTAALILLLLTSACAGKKNTALTRQWSAFTTRYNIFFNGEQAYLETLKSMEESHEDNFSEQLFLHPVSQMATDESEPSQAFERAIEKCQKAIQLKSMPKRPPRSNNRRYDDEYKAFLNRKEFNPFLHQAWLLMGKSQYYQGDFLGANATFQYIIRNFKWLPETVQESRIWSAKSYCEMGWIFEAENQIQQIDSTKITSEIRKPYHEAMTLYALKKENKKQAITHLEQLTKQRYGKEQKARMQFLLGQLYRDTGDPIKAYAHFGKVAKMNPPYRTLFNARIAQTEVMPTQQSEKIEKRLNKMLRDPRNKTYLDQIYYAKGNLALHARDSVKAIEQYQKALSESSRGGIEKALAAIRLGDVSFAREQYLVAQPAYATAISILKESHTDYPRVSKLSGVLDNLAVHAQTVHLQDSLLRLASLPEEEQLKEIQKTIDRLIEEEKQAAEAALREEYENNKGNYDRPDLVGPTQPTINTGDNSWYFYNKIALNAGKTEFQRKWGSRKPEDNWRRRDKTNELSNLFADESENSQEEGEIAEEEIVEGEETTTPDSLSTDPKNPAYYLSQLPTTPEAKAQANEMIEEATFQMGVIFNQQLNNLPLATKTFLDIEERYPTSPKLLDVYYEVYLLLMRQQKETEANIYRNKLISMFADSPYAIALKDTDYVKNIREMEQKQNKLYEETYQAYLKGQNQTVHKNYTFVKENWPLSSLMPQFQFLNALAYASENNSEAFKEQIQALTAIHAESAVGPLASQMMQGIMKGREISSENGPTRGMIWETPIIFEEGGAAASDSSAFAFTMLPDRPHLLVLAYPTDSLNTNDLLFHIAKYNFTNYLVKDFDLETITFGNLSMLIIKGFNNFDELSHYRLRMSLPQGFKLPNAVTPVMISDDNFRLLLQGRSFDDYFSFIEKCTQELITPQE